MPGHNPYMGGVMERPKWKPFFTPFRLKMFVAVIVSVAWICTIAFGPEWLVALFRAR